MENGARPAPRLGPLQVVRAFAVMLGGPLLLAAAAGWSVAATAVSVLRPRPVRPLALAGTIALALYALLLRPRHLRWGAEEGDLERALPGDELMPAGGTETLRAVTIDAPPEAVWPWLAQIGQDRGGFYSYEWLENLAGCEMRNAEQIHPEWQHREPGEMVLLHPAAGLDVTVFEPGRALALRGWGSFVVEPAGPRRSRLIARGRRRPGIFAAAYGALLEIPHFLMERRMLLGIKERAEREPHDPRP